MQDKGVCKCKARGSRFHPLEVLLLLSSLVLCALALDALHYAADDMQLYSTPGNPQRYIVLITDNPFHSIVDGLSVYSKTGRTKGDEV